MLIAYVYTEAMGNQRANKQAHSSFASCYEDQKQLAFIVCMQWGKAAAAVAYTHDDDNDKVIYCINTNHQQ